MIDEKVRKAHDEIARAEGKRVSLFTVLAVIVVLVGSFALLKSYGIVGKAVSVPAGQECNVAPDGHVSGILPVQVGQYVIGWTGFVTSASSICSQGVHNIPFPEQLDLLLLGDSCTAPDGKIQFVSQGRTTTFPIACIDADYNIVEQSGRIAQAACEGNNARITSADCQCSFGGCVQQPVGSPQAVSVTPPAQPPPQTPPISSSGLTNLEKGSLCVASSECAQGLVCRRITTKKGEFYGDKKCEGPRADGGKCEANTDCESRKCEGEKCVEVKDALATPPAQPPPQSPPPPPLPVCSSDADCGQFKSCTEKTAGAGVKCLNWLRTECANDDECVANAVCQDKSEGKKLCYGRDNQQCGNDNYCAQGYTCMKQVGAMMGTCTGLQPAAVGQQPAGGAQILQAAVNVPAVIPPAPGAGVGIFSAGGAPVGLNIPPPAPDAVAAPQPIVVGAAAPGVPSPEGARAVVGTAAKRAGFGSPGAGGDSKIKKSSKKKLSESCVLPIECSSGRCVKQKCAAAVGGYQMRIPFNK